MRKRKLQIFISSTYEDLIDERLAAMEAILAAGHIPAAMEQFSPGDETAWEIIRNWIDESDAFILILGGRYGSIEPQSGRSYVQLEYEYVVEKKKPFFALVVDKQHHEQRVMAHGLAVDERANPEMYRTFKDLVTGRLCSLWSDKKDIKTKIFQKLPEWAQRPDLVGWVRADEALNPEVMNELARLSHENRKLREEAEAQVNTIEGLEFNQLIRLLENVEVPEEIALDALRKIGSQQGPASITNLLQLFETLFEDRFRIHIGYDEPIHRGTIELVSMGLVEIADAILWISASGKRFRNMLLVRAMRSKQITIAKPYVEQ